MSKLFGCTNIKVSDSATQKLSDKTFRAIRRQKLKVKRYGKKQNTSVSKEEAPNARAHVKLDKSKEGKDFIKNLSDSSLVNSDCELSPLKKPCNKVNIKEVEGINELKMESGCEIQKSSVSLIEEPSKSLKPLSTPNLEQSVGEERKSSRIITKKIFAEQIDESELESSYLLNSNDYSIQEEDEIRTQAKTQTDKNSLYPYFNKRKISKHFTPQHNNWTPPYAHHFTPYSVMTNSPYYPTHFPMPYPPVYNHQTLPTYQSTYAHTAESTKKVDTQSSPLYCNQCEEIYKYCIFNKLGLKKIKCIYCNVTLNNVTFEYFIEKYKEELQQFYFDKINQEHDFEDLKQFDTNLRESYKSFYPTKSSGSAYYEAKKDFKKQLFERKRSEKASNYPKSMIVQLDDVSNQNLAEAFALKKKSLADKMKNRKLQSSDNQISLSNDKSSNSVRPSQFKKEQKLKNSKNKEGSSKSPSKDLIDRLLKGEKAKLSKEEIKKINSKFIKHLPEIKIKEWEELKKIDFQNRTQIKNNYVKNLQKSVLMKEKL